MKQRLFMLVTFLVIAGAVTHARAFDCTISAYGSVPTGEVFSGSGSDVGGLVEGEWTHNGDGIHVQSEGLPFDVACRTNGGLVGEVFGAAILNGVSGYQYFVQVADNRGPPTGSSIVLEASRERNGRPHVGVQRFAAPTSFRIPAEIAVTAGEAGGGRVMLKIDGTVCWYRGNGDDLGCGGDAFLFDACVGEDGSSLAPGDQFDGVQARLHILGDDLHCPTGPEAIAIRADIGTGLVPAPGAPDAYTILVGDAAGTLLYSFSALVETGDVAVEPVP
jgi:hypothetical protein